MTRTSAFLALAIPMVTALVSSLGGRVLAQSDYTYRTIYHTYAGSINNRDQIVGNDFTPTSLDGYVLDKGTSTTLLGTQAVGINDWGQIVGLAPSGSVLIDRGHITPIDVPDSLFNFTLGLNNCGQVCGLSFGFDFLMHGFVLDMRTGRCSDINHPDAVIGTALLGINDRGQAVGYYVDADWNFIGFLYEDGVFTTLDGPHGESVYPSAINNLGQIAGDMDGRGFVLTDGQFATLDVPGSVPGSVGARGINDRGQVVGFFLDADGNQLSYVATPSR